ncbi:hypothetical protein RF11_02496 [Thelohanellus kitauei]|uniref:Alpha-soluble NSF attachment protein n=1 Tax=Thelohanellus kitauei TaxID=669202 RepID=A0A0C2ML74_THEKT|nr:hypothetical protein RF11_02496 [Thelohanellus kitauei]
MTQIEIAHKLIDEAQQLVNVKPKLFGLIDSNNSKRKAHDKFIIAGEIYKKLGENEKAKEAYISAASITENSFKDYNLAIKEYELAHSCHSGTDSDFDLSFFTHAVEICFKICDMKRAEEYLESAESNLNRFKIDISRVCEYYEKIINSYVDNIKKDDINGFLYKYRFKHAESLFTLHKHQRAIEIFRNIIVTNNEKNGDKELTERCCVYACLIVIIWFKAEYIQQYIKKVCELSRDFEYGEQYSIIKRILESLKNKDYEDVEDAGLNIDEENIKLFNKRAKNKMEALCQSTNDLLNID